jgi:glycosyltransferase involved in cell wall biosynthesis
MTAAISEVRPQADIANDRIPVSVIVMTKNEETNIRACLSPITRFAEIFVVDSNSTDSTATIASEMGARVIPFTWDGRYPKKKQWCLDNLPLTYDWVLYVDADEQLSPELVDEIGDLLRSTPRASGYFLRFDNAFLGKRLRHGLKNFKLVLFNRHNGRFLDYNDLDVATMWEVEGHYQPQVQGELGVLRNRAVHADFRGLHQYFERLNRYSDWEAAIRTKGHITAAGESQLASRALLKRIFHHMPAKSLAMFLYSYIYKGGFLDGREGLAFAIARFFYYWQVSLKIRELRTKGQRCGEGAATGG